MKRLLTLLVWLSLVVGAVGQTQENTKVTEGDFRGVFQLISQAAVGDVDGDTDTDYTIGGVFTPEANFGGTNPGDPIDYTILDFANIVGNPAFAGRMVFWDANGYRWECETSLAPGAGENIRFTGLNINGHTNVPATGRGAITLEYPCGDCWIPLWVPQEGTGINAQLQATMATHFSKTVVACVMGSKEVLQTTEITAGAVPAPGSLTYPGSESGLANVAYNEVTGQLFIWDILNQLWIELAAATTHTLGVVDVGFDPETPPATPLLPDTELPTANIVDGSTHRQRTNDGYVIRWERVGAAWVYGGVVSSQVHESESIVSTFDELKEQLTESQLARTQASILIDGRIEMDTALEIPRTVTLRFVPGSGIIDTNGFDLHYMSKPGAEPDQQIFSKVFPTGTANEHVPGDVKGFFGGGPIHVGWFGANGMAMKVRTVGSASLESSGYRGTISSGTITFIKHGLLTGDVVFQSSSADDATRMRATPYTVTKVDENTFTVAGWSDPPGGVDISIYKDATWGVQAAVYAVDDTNSGPGSYHTSVKFPSGQFWSTQQIDLTLAATQYAGASGQAPRLIGAGSEYTRLSFVADTWTAPTTALKAGVVGANFQFGIVIQGMAMYVHGMNDRVIDTLGLIGAPAEASHITDVRVIHCGRGRAINFANADGSSPALPFQVILEHGHHGISGADGTSIGINALSGHTLGIRDTTINGSPGFSLNGSGATVTFNGTTTIGWLNHGFVVGDIVRFGVHQFGRASTADADFTALGITRGGAGIVDYSRAYRITSTNPPSEFTMNDAVSGGADITGIAPLGGERVAGSARLSAGINLQTSTLQHNTLSNLFLINCKTGVEIADGALSADNVMGLQCEKLFVLKEGTSELGSVSITNCKSRAPDTTISWLLQPCTIDDQVLGIRRGSIGALVNYSTSQNTFLTAVPAHGLRVLHDDPLPLPITHSATVPLLAYNSSESISMWRTSNGLTTTNVTTLDIWKNAMPRRLERQLGFDLLPSSTPPTLVAPTFSGRSWFNWASYGSYHTAYSPWDVIPRDGFTVLLVMRNSSMTAGNAPFFVLGYDDSVTPKVALDRINTDGPDDNQLGLTIVDAAATSLDVDSTRAGFLREGVISLRFSGARQEVRWNGNLSIENDTSGTDFSTSDFSDELPAILAGTTVTTAHTLAVGDRVTLHADTNFSAVGNGFVSGQDYYVVSTGPYTIAETPGGTPITFTPVVGETFTMKRSPKIHVGGAPVGGGGLVQIGEVYVLPGYISDADLNTWGNWLTSKYNELGTGGKTSRTWGWSDVRY